MDLMTTGAVDRCVLDDKTVVFSMKGLDPEIRRELNACAKIMVGKNDEARGRERVKIDGRTYFCKFELFSGKRRKFRATFGIYRRGMLERSLEEISNLLKSQACGLTPKIYAFGYRKNMLGLVSNVFIIQECLEGAINLEEYLRASPQKVEQIATQFIRTVKSAVSRGVVHLDPWARNVMTTPDLSRAWLVDLEYCRVGEKNWCVEQALGFSCCHFFLAGICDYLSWPEYRKLVLDICSSSVELDLQRLSSFLDDFHANERSRKQRLQEFPDPNPVHVWRRLCGVGFPGSSQWYEFNGRPASALPARSF